jgi:cytochrome P450
MVHFSLTSSRCCHRDCRETLRLSNVVASLPVEAAQDLTLGGYAVPAGTP